MDISEGNTRNACFCFGDKPENSELFKAGTLIGMNAHAVFPGDWGNRKHGETKSANFKDDDVFEATIKIDLEHGEYSLEIAGHTLHGSLPESLESVKYVGFNVKDTHTQFSEVEKLSSWSC